MCALNQGPRDNTSTMQFTSKDKTRDYHRLCKSKHEAVASASREAFSLPAQTHFKRQKEDFQGSHVHGFQYTYRLGYLGCTQIYKAKITVAGFTTFSWPSAKGLIQPPSHRDGFTSIYHNRFWPKDNNMLLSGPGL